MSVAYRIDVSRNTITPATRALAAGYAPAVIHPVIGRAASEATRKHYIDLDRDRPNALGGSRTHYYLGAARGTSFTVVEDGVIISSRQIGLRLRYYGTQGTPLRPKGINPKTGKPIRFLTIPVHPAAHGHRASEFDLEVVYNHDGVPVALATKSTLGVSLKETKTGKVTKRAVGRRGEIYFLLRRYVDQKPDPSVLPAPDRIYGAVTSSVNAHVDRIVARSGNAASA